jgi:cell division protein FtsI/penicillin-binding protein 2
VEPNDLQRWLFDFGYGRTLPLACPLTDPNDPLPRHLRQVPGQIASKYVPANAKIESLDDLPALRKRDLPLFGIGHGNLWATPLQVANSFATLARGGQSRPPRLFLSPKSLAPDEARGPVDLPVSALALQTVHDGMDAVVNEPGGTAYKEFRPSDLARQGVKVLGKTGSTERPYDAWFAGFAEDHEGAKIALAVIVEGGQHGSSDAAPLARDIVQLCVDKGYVGSAVSASPPSATVSN